MIRTKKILTKLLIMLIILLLVLSTTSIVLSVVKKDKKPNTKPKAYDFTGFNRTDFGSVYNSNDTFLIKDATAFKNFCSTTSQYQCFDVWGGYWIEGTAYNYKEKTVKMEADIDLSGWEGTIQLLEDVSSVDRLSWYFNAINVFNGIFDGQGHTIKNYSSNEHAFNTALFGTINGTVKNTKFYNFSSYSDGILHGAGVVRAGTITQSVGSGGVIDSCIVEKCSFGSGRSRGDFYCGGIAGSNSGTIKNCIVKGSYTLKADDGFLGISACGIDAYPFVSSGKNATNSIFTASYSKSGADNSETAYSTSLGEGNYSSYEKAQGKLTNCSKVCGNIDDYPDYQWFEYEADFIPSFSVTIPGLGFFEDETVIIYEPVYLRAFMKFKMITFSAGEGGSVSHADVWVPEEYSEVITDNDNATAQVYSVTVTAAPDGYHEFDYWDGYKAMFVRRYIDITFSNFTLNGVTFTPAVSSGEVPTKIDYNGEAIIKYNGIVDGKVEYEVSLRGETIKVYYTLIKVYSVTKNKDGITKTSNSITVNPPIIFKTYGVIWL